MPGGASSLIAAKTTALLPTCVAIAGCRLRPCLHAALCVECAQGLKARHYACPICNTQIESLEAGSFAKTYSVDEAAA